MSLKDFLVPDKTKVLVFVLFMVSILVFEFFTACPCAWAMGGFENGEPGKLTLTSYAKEKIASEWFMTPSLLLSEFTLNHPNGGIIEGLGSAFDLFYRYIISCLIVFVGMKIKKWEAGS